MYTARVPGNEVEVGSGGTAVSPQLRRVLDEVGSSRLLEPNPVGARCPRCGAGYVTVMRQRGFLEVLARALGWNAFACEVCPRRFRAFRRPSTIRPAFAGR